MYSILCQLRRFVCASYRGVLILEGVLSLFQELKCVYSVLSQLRRFVCPS